jgi:hypothetical protein
MMSAEGFVTIYVGEIPLLEAGVLMATTELDLGRYKLGWHDVEDYVFKPPRRA